MKFFATAPRGLSQALADELRALGAERLQPGGAGVNFEGTLEVGYRACLWSRLANRVLLPLTTVAAETPERLYAEVGAIHWERHLHSSGSLAITVAGTGEGIGHSQYALHKVKDAVVDRFRARFGERPDIDTERPDLLIHIHLRGARARISIDLSGGSLHRRGYRVQSVTAPLKENLAAGILTLAGWPAIAAEGGALLDPMCGSGTLLIEGAMMAADMAPGLGREHFGFLGWRRHERELWQGLLAEAATRREAGLGRLPPILGFDCDPGAVAATRENIAAAGLEDFIEVDRRELGPGLAALLPKTPGLVVVNPPYGERLGEVNALRADYARLGEVVGAELADWRLALFTGNPELAGYVGLQETGRDTLFNGPIECALFRFEPGAEAPPLSDGARAFANRLGKNLKHLARWARREGVECYRVYDADLPEYALAVDLYQGERLWVHVQEYQAPKKVDEEKAQQRLAEALAVIPQVLEIPPAQLFFKVRRRQKGRAQYDKLAAAGHFHEVREGPCRLLVNFGDYLDTGLFLDHRLTRQMLGELAAGKHFLNLFCYTASASVHAAHGGALSTTSVDMSRTYLEWARRNLELNGFSAPAHRLERADCMQWLTEAAGRKRRFDLIFIDPPTFSNSKRMERVFDVQRDHVRLLQDAARLLAPGGVIIFSNNFRKFRLDEAALTGLAAEEISRQTLPEDFRRNPKIHRCWRITQNTD